MEAKHLTPDEIDRFIRTIPEWEYSGGNYTGSYGHFSATVCEEEIHISAGTRVIGRLGLTEKVRSLRDYVLKSYAEAQLLEDERFRGQFRQELATTNTPTPAKTF